MCRHLSRIYLECRMKKESDFESEISIGCIPGTSHISKSKWIVPRKFALARNNLNGYMLRYTLLSNWDSVRWYKPKVVPSMSSSDMDQPTEDEQPVDKAQTFSLDIEYSRIDCLIWVIHESANSFSLAVQTLESARRYPELAMAWTGVDVYSWHRKISYQVAVYALFKAAIEVELFLSHKRHPTASASEILYPTINSLGKCIKDLLNSRNPNLVHWFEMVELPRIAELFIPLFKRWSLDYAGSGVAGIILAISCCIAVRKLGSRRLSGPSLYVSIENILIKLMNSSYTLVSMGKLHHLASEAGFEEEFLLHFGKKIMPAKSTEDIEFWIGLVQKKLSVAFHRESVISGKQANYNKDEENDLAILGLFAFLGKETRLFLSRMKIKDLDEHVEDFLNYLECGSVFINPRFSSLIAYQLFMEVITDEIGWLDFYAEYNCKFQDKRKSKKRTIQAKQEIILYTVFTICYDVFSGLAHYFSTNQRPVDSKLHEFLHRSQSLLSICLEDYWAAYDRSGEPVKKTEGDAKKFTNSCLGVVNERQPPSKSSYSSILCKTTSKLMSASTALRIGTWLLLVDVVVSINLVLKQLWGEKVTERERKKIARTLADVSTLAPVTILMLIPMSAVAHVVMIIAIKTYIPALIPSSYSSERLNMVKQLEKNKGNENSDMEQH
ncbi:uncharacterized protein LOC141723887 isoform X2 [Apium graveolens]|uniref:uncharacterized protein LOC141723887 isoform X2 n=1 Tax=Apium graveolens TaxID=4045 RepID=UPI003D79B2A4